MIREAEDRDLQRLLELYTHLHESGVPRVDERFSAAWEQIKADSNHHIIVAEENGKLVSTCVLVVIPNLTRGARPYAIVENVVTSAPMRRRGWALACLKYAMEIAKSAGCYKIMLFTGSKDEGTLSFYKRAGFSDKDKTGFVQWL